MTAVSKMGTGRWPPTSSVRGIRSRELLLLIHAAHAGTAALPKWIERLCRCEIDVPAELIEPRHAKRGQHPLALHRFPPSTFDGNGRQWWSGGDDLWLPAPAVAVFFAGLFEKIQRSFSHVVKEEICLSPGDFYHGHIFAIDCIAHASICGQRAGCSSILGAVFHAKECPADLGGRGGYDSRQPSFKSRNLLWLSSINTIYIIRPPIGSRWEALLQFGVEWSSIDPSLRVSLLEEYGGEAPHRRAYTLSEVGFRELAPAVPQGRLGFDCDVNYVSRMYTKKDPFVFCALSAPPKGEQRSTRRYRSLL